ncbi:acetoacetate--CoA ligase [Actinomadura oligospora]|uniref:acetoacetate--CoA ligase n=1 Tax=Actinomadura oligospora TaxID=111804 RepID=UPI00047B158C|nr:acetoacetate--CoA ligase [Actinomadura oligospora]
MSQQVPEGLPLWRPSEGVVADARVTHYRNWLRDRGVATESYADLWKWSTAEIDAFWDSIWEYFGVLGERGEGPVRSGGPMPVDGLRWYPGATLNYARNVLQLAPGDPEDAAVIFRSEAGGHRVISRRALAEHVAQVRAGLAELGVGRGDRVAAYVPNIPEALVCFLAAASLGAVWSSCSPDFGASSVIDRFAQIEPKVLIAVDGYAYNDRRFDRRDVIRDIEAALPTVTSTILIPYLDPASAPDGLRAGMSYADLPKAGAELEFEDVPFDHPLWVVYSSGTTGLPKPIVHGHGGIVLEHLKALSFHQDLGPGDVFFWYTTTGWMMWNYLVGGLLVGATVVMYDGAPGDLWKLAADNGVTYMGVGAPYITASMKLNRKPGERYDLSRLRGIGSTGSPLPPEGFAWVYESVGEDLLVGSFSGGTDVCTGFIGPSPVLPLYAGVLQCRGLGAKIEAFSEKGEPVIDEVGELVLTEPMPCMPVFFWNDEDGHRYRESYFDMFPGVWRHGDWLKVRPDGGCVIYGRSDSTLNRGGIRMGTADFYRVVEAFDEIADSLVIDTGRLGQEGRLLLYVQMAEGQEFTDELAARLKREIRSALSPRHVPDEFHVVPGVPRTLSGKKLEVPVRKILQGTPVEQAANVGAMANPEVLKYYTQDS